jgi:hypothetical protein
MCEWLAQPTDPAVICEHAVWHLGADRGMESTLGLAAIGSPSPFRDCSLAASGVWHAFCRAHAVVAELNRRDHPMLDRLRMGSNWSVTTNTAREDLLRRSAAWLREHGGSADVDDELAWQEYYPGAYRCIIKDPKLSYLGPHIKDSTVEAIADARRLLRKVADRKAYEAGDTENFKEVHTRVCGVTYSEVVRKDAVQPGR